MRSCYLFLFLLPTILFAQLNPADITIARDSWGVPHIHAPTDAGVAYGLAWASSEDDFQTMQEQLLAIRGQLGRVRGKDGAAIDIAVQFMQLDEIVNERYESDLTPGFRAIVDGYVAGANAYALAHPEEVLRKELFPIHPHDLIKGYMLGLALLTGTEKPLSQILNNSIQKLGRQTPKGSNAFAINRSRTTDGKTYLAINSHQPLEGLYSWYEAHLVSDEGLNILGATFPGGISLFQGANEQLGWAHTVNHPDFADVYELDMHPNGSLQYRFDGEWLALDKHKAKTKVKLGPFVIPVKRRYYVSKYGLTLENKQGMYALRFAANQDIRAAEQWFRMNKAQNFEEFQAALAMQGLTGTNIVYADRADNIFYISNARLPHRNPAYNWRKILPGNTSATLWDTSIYPLDSLPQVLNPASGYVFNSNHSPFLATRLGENPPASDFPTSMGYGVRDNNRSIRFRELIEAEDQLDYEDFKRIKYDLRYADRLYDHRAENLDELVQLDPTKYPDLAETLAILQSWDHQTDTNSIGASILILALHDIFEELGRTNRQEPGNRLKESEMVHGLRFARDHLQKHFSSLRVPLGHLQRHVRGNVNLAIPGGPEVLAAMYGQLTKDGHLHSYAGESYIELVRFSDTGVEIESVNAYGASAKPGSPHYTDQMKLFVEQRTKIMSLDWEKALREAVRVYHPGE